MGMYCDLMAVDQDNLLRLLVEPESVGAILDDDSRPSVDLQKSWHGLHYLLNGSGIGGEPPLDFLLVGGEPIGEDDSGIRLLRPDDVRRLAEALDAIDDARLWGRFDPGAMVEEGIYPNIWDEPAADLREEYTGYFRDLKAFLHQASDDGMAVVITIA
ncbi:YfbM family protein [Tautonia rosea]|uniref:YfbM family protein n=1 Tax=Tautonia rosea TaxID=2728037 RepID=UPI0014759F18|nr:YfbM family protein [Tautonia rosea]